MKPADYPKSVHDALKLEEVPVVSIDQESIFVYINPEFERTYGWSAEELLGKSVNEIIPHHMRDAHSIGFSRFLATETSEILAMPLNLPILHKDGRVQSSIHYIIGDKADGRWRFAAVITPER